VKEFGIDIEDGFKPIYQPLQQKEGIISRLREEARECSGENASLN